MRVLVNGNSLMTELTIGTHLARLWSVVRVEMKTTTGDQKRKMSTRQVQPRPSPKREPRWSWARSCQSTSSGSGGMDTANSATSARYCSLEASRCQNSEVKVTKPAGDTTFESWSRMASSTQAISAATSVSASSRSRSNLSTSARLRSTRSLGSWPAFSRALCASMSRYFTVVNCPSFWRSFGVFLTTYADSIASSLNTSMKYAFNASSER
mmetsp:Transcript_88179/g.244726  ORF Transcript_88179/g.244726 Transcript_88179/m.244726 type:complete len:211 (-) Transcript_88179:1255-1887(-)